MDRNFARSLALVLKSEGGWSDNPADPGGATMKGVTLANFRRYVKADASKADLRKISDDQVATVYRRFYWDAVLGAELPDGVDYAVFDFAVNSGPSRAAKYLQAITGVPQDGRIGPATIAAVKTKPADIINALCDARLAFLKRLPTWGTFGKGWASRVESVRKVAIAMTAPAPVKPIRSAEDALAAQQADDAAKARYIPPKPAHPAPPAINKPATAAGLFAIIAIAAANWWHHITAFVSNLF